MKETKLAYAGPSFYDAEIDPVSYRDEFFRKELDLESDLFHEMRKQHGIRPFRIDESPIEELEKIRKFFNENKDTFFFLLDDENEIIASILLLDNFIQSLCVHRRYQRQGYATRLVKYAVNDIFSRGYPNVVLKVLGGNEPAMKLYMGLGFEIVAET